jgi:hypothetical protein
VDSKSSSLWGGWCFEPLGLYGVGLWKGWGMFSSHTRSEVGAGFKVRFCHDMWCGDKALKEALPNLYGIAHVKDASVVAHLELSSGSN